MTYQGHIENGSIVFNEALNLPEGTEVTVSIVPKKSNQEGDVPSIYEQLKPFFGKIEGLPPDASQNIDHYLYGHPKK
jgi:hypothetical protein